MGDYALTTSKLCKYYGQNQILENVTSCYQRVRDTVTELQG